MPSLTSLPSEIVPLLFPFLSGFDLVHLSHAHPLLLHGPLAVNNDVWRDRLPAHTPFPDGMSWKQVYCTRVSLYFPGTSNAHEREGALEIHNYSLDTWENESFSWDVWFALQPPNSSKPGSCVGGVLLGAQSEDWQDEWTPETYETFAYISPDGALECSIGDEKPVIAQDLQLLRWYHLALTFENHGENGTQSVYLDGKRIHTCATRVAEEWEGFYYMQLASGYVGKNDPNKHPPGPKGWYDFNGIIDSFRIFDVCLAAEAIVQLAQCEAPPRASVWSFDPSESAMFGTAKQVHCSRPRERVCTDLICSKDLDEDADEVESDVKEKIYTQTSKRQRPNV